MKRTSLRLLSCLLLCCWPDLLPAHGVRTRLIEIVHPWTSSVRPDEPTHVAMTIRNRGNRPDRLLRAETELAKEVFLVEAFEGDKAGMRLVASMAVNAGQAIELQPSGQRIVLHGVSRSLSPYDTFVLSLYFERAGRVDVDVLVEE